MVTFSVIRRVFVNPYFVLPSCTDPLFHDQRFCSSFHFPRNRRLKVRAEEESRHRQEVDQSRQPTPASMDRLEKKRSPTLPNEPLLCFYLDHPQFFLLVEKKVLREVIDTEGRVFEVLDRWHE